jgi:hypothetical protein
MVAPDSQAKHACRQAAIPLAALFKNPQPPLNSISVEGRNYSTSEKRAKAVLINKDHSRKIHLVMQAGKCNATFVLEIDPGLKSQVSERATQGAILDINVANFLFRQGSGFHAPPQQCQGRCMENDRATDQANCLTT